MLTFNFAHQIGKGMAANGSSFNDVVKYLADNCIDVKSISGRRVLKSFNDQLARG